MRGSRETTVDITVYSERHNGTTGWHEGTRIWKEKILNRIFRNTEAEANFFEDVRITNSNRYQDDARTKRISQC
jgi:hypothetical protein